MVPFLVPMIIRHLLLRVPKKGAIILTTSHMWECVGIRRLGHRFCSPSFWVAARVLEVGSTRMPSRTPCCCCVVESVHIQITFRSAAVLWSQHASKFYVAALLQYRQCRGVRCQNTSAKWQEEKRIQPTTKTFGWVEQITKLGC